MSNRWMESAAIFVIFLMFLVLLSAGCGNKEKPGVTEPEPQVVFVRDGDVHLLNPGDDSVKKLTNSGYVTAIDVGRESNAIYYATFDPEKDPEYETDPGALTFEKVSLDGSSHDVIKCWGAGGGGGGEPIEAISVTPSEDAIYFSLNSHQVSAYFSDVRRLDVKTGEIAVTCPVRDDQDPWESYIFPAVSPSGDKIACIHAIGKGRPGTSAWLSSVNICVMDTNGQNINDIYELPIPTEWEYPDKPLTGPQCAPCWSPDGSSIAFVGEGSQIWTISADGENLKKITSMDKECYAPDWSSEGELIAFASLTGRDDHWYTEGNIYSVPSGGGEAEPLTDSNKDTQAHWASIEEQEGDAGGIVFVRDGNVLKTGKDTPIYSGGDIYDIDEVSPDGKKIAVHKKHECGEYVNWVMDSDGGNLKPLFNLSEVPGQGAGSGQRTDNLGWSGDGKSLYVLTLLLEYGGVLYEANADGKNLREYKKAKYQGHYNSFDISRNNKIAFIEAIDEPNAIPGEVKISELDGSNEVLICDVVSAWRGLAISPDQRH